METLFSPYGKIVAVMSRKTLNLKGQAFIVFEKQEDAEKALEDMQSFPVYFKPMVLEF
jgi:RNA recognition motif-containing protein